MDSETTNQSAKHVKRTWPNRLISISALFALVASTLVATLSPSQASIPDVEYYCDEQSAEFDSDWNGWSGSFNDMYGITLELNTFTSQLVNELDKRITVSFNGGSSVLSTAAYLITDIEPGVDAVTIDFLESVTIANSEDVWPITLTQNFTGVELDVENQEAFFEDFETCSASVGDALTDNTTDAFDRFGYIKALGSSGYDPIRPLRLTKTETDGVTNFSYMVEGFYSAAADDFVDVHVEAEFIGNTVTYSVSAFEPGTDTPSSITFFIEGNLGSDSRTQRGTSNGHLVTSDDGNGDPLIIFGSDGESNVSAGDAKDYIRFDFEATSTGYLEATVFGYNRCASIEDVLEAVDEFTSSYSASKNSNLQEVEGDCSRTCEPSQAVIEVSPNVFDLSGVPLCFDQVRETEDGPLLEQEVLSDGPSFGGGMVQGDSIDYQAVVQGADKTLNAVLTATSLFQLQSNQLGSADLFEYRNNSWINTFILVTEGDIERYVTYSLFFYEEGDDSKTPVQVSNFELSILDLDDYEFFVADNVAEYYLSRDTILRASSVSGNRLRVSENRGIDSDSEEDSRVVLRLNQSSLHTFTMGRGRSITTPGGEFFGLDFTGQVGWEQTPVDRSPSQGTSSANGNPVILDVKPNKVTSKNQTITILGSSLGSATGLEIAGKSVKIISKSNGKITFAAPSGLSGAHDVTLVFPNFTLVEPKALVYSPKLNRYARKALLGFAADKIDLTKKMKREIRRFVESNQVYVRVACKGFVSQSSHPDGKVLANQRGKAACDYISREFPNMVVKVVKGALSNRQGASGNRVRITLR